ncbi:MAG: hypothetical protein IPG68_16060 [Micrococcales bacterium]|nr:hypothetical protein [Micrococcales bacterium]
MAAWTRSVVTGGAMAALMLGLTATGAASDEVPCDPATGQVCDPTPTPTAPTPQPDYTPAPTPTSPTDNLPPIEQRLPGKIAKARSFFGDGSVRVKWGVSERATAYRVRIVKVVVQAQRKRATGKKPGVRRILKPRPWQETTKREYKWNVTQGIRYRVQVKGVNNVGSGPITAVEFIVP